MPRCAACGHEGLPGASFCLNCGNALAPAAQTPAVAAGLPTICQVCRGENPPGMKFCRNCGASLAAQPAGGGAPMMAPSGGMAATIAAPSGVIATPPPPRPPAPAPAALQQTSGPRVAQGSTINCPRCGTTTPLGFTYCQQCGLQLQAVAPTDPGALAPPPAAQPARAPAIGQGSGVDVQAATLAQPDAGRAAALGLHSLSQPAPSPFPPAPSAPPPSSPGIAPTARPSSAQQPAARPSGTSWGTAILVNRDGSDGQRFVLTSEDTIVGRAGADIAFDDDRFLARQHARIERAADGNVRVHPIDTVNGVYKKADGAVELADGTMILVGREVLRFERVSPDERTVTPLVRHGVSVFGSPPRDPWGRLVQLIPSGGWRDIRHLIANEIVLGREEGEIVFRDDAFMSRRHAALTWDGKRAMLTDLGSSNGTFVRILGATSIKHGDHVRMGDQLLRIER